MTAEDVWKSALTAAERGILIDDQLQSAEVKPHLALALEIGEAILLTSNKQDHVVKAVAMLRKTLQQPKALAQSDGACATQSVLQASSATFRLLPRHPGRQQSK